MGTLLETALWKEVVHLKAECRGIVTRQAERGGGHDRGGGGGGGGGVEEEEGLRRKKEEEMKLFD